LRLEDIEKKLQSVIVSIKPDRGPEGKLYDETAMGAIRVLTRISPNELTEKDIPNINALKVREYLLRLMQEKKSELGDEAFIEVKKYLQQRYKFFDVLRTKWATTTALQNLSDRDIISLSTPIYARMYLDMSKKNPMEEN
jgi:hypothetical protein